MTTMAKAYKGMGMEGGIARWYDKTTRRDMPAFRELAAQIASVAAAAGTVLEVAPGPGFLSIELAKRGLDVQAVDISKTFIEIARKNAAEAGVRAVFMHGNAAELPVRKECVDFVVCRAAFKNFTEPVKAMREMLRVLKPGGTALLIDMRRDVSVEELRKYIDGWGVSWFSRKVHDGDVSRNADQARVSAGGDKADGGKKPDGRRCGLSRRRLGLRRG